MKPAFLDAGYSIIPSTYKIHIKNEYNQQYIQYLHAIHVNSIPIHLLF